MKKYIVVPGEVEVTADSYDIDPTGALQFFDEDEELISMWARDRWHRVSVRPIEAEA